MSTFVIPPSRLHPVEPSPGSARSVGRGAVAALVKSCYATCCETHGPNDTEVVTTSVDAVFVRSPAVGGRLVAQRDVDAVARSRATSQAFVAFFLLMELLALWDIFFRTTSFCHPHNVRLLEDQQPAYDAFLGWPRSLRGLFVVSVIMANVVYGLLFSPHGHLNDPGFLDVHGGDQLHPDEIGVSVDFMPLCSACGHHRPLRSRHCRSCGRCVAKNDHHCFWLGTCVGPRNYFGFVCLVWWMAVATSLGSLLVGASVATSGMNDDMLGCEPNPEWSVWLWNNAAPLVALLTGIATALFSWGLFFAHLYLASANITTFEFVRPERNRYLEAVGKLHYAKSPFSQGVWSNLVDAWFNLQARRCLFAALGGLAGRVGLRKGLSYVLLNTVSHGAEDDDVINRSHPHVGDAINFDLPTASARLSVQRP